MEGAVADRMHRDGDAPSPALRRGMMPFDLTTQGPTAEPALLIALRVRRLSQARHRTA